MKKTFDCVEMKRRGAEQVQQHLKNRTSEDQRLFWSERTEALRARRAELQQREQTDMPEK